MTSLSECKNCQSSIALSPPSYNAVMSSTYRKLKTIWKVQLVQNTAVHSLRVSHFQHQQQYLSGASEIAKQNTQVFLKDINAFDLYFNPYIACILAISRPDSVSIKSKEVL